MMKNLARYSAARKALAAAVRIDEVKDLRDKALAMEVYAYQAKDRELVSLAAEMKRRAVRRIGELLEKQRIAGKLSKGGDRKGYRVASRPSIPSSLAEQGIDKHLADAARKAAAMSEREFEASVTKAVRGAVAAVDGDKAIIKEARAEQNKAKKQRRSQRERELATKIVALPDKRYGLIYVDPEWKDEVWSEDTGSDRAAANHYPVSDIETLRERPVSDIAAKDCVMAMWTTNQHLKIAIGLMEDWGFDYKSNYVWVKQGNASTGRWNRSRHEILLIGTRGTVPCPAPGTQWDSVIEAPKGKHSAKPKAVMEMLEQYFPNLPKIELNCRGKPRPGWDGWGAEVEGYNEAAE
jgi:N6-adenosine-specific RNA methylase IME4